MYIYNSYNSYVYIYNSYNSYVYIYNSYNSHIRLTRLVSDQGVYRVEGVDTVNRHLVKSFRKRRFK